MHEQQRPFGALRVGVVDQPLTPCDPSGALGDVTSSHQLERQPERRPHRSAHVALGRRGVVQPGPEIDAVPTGERGGGGQAFEVVEGERLVGVDRGEPCVSGDPRLLVERAAGQLERCAVVEVVSHAASLASPCARHPVSRKCVDRSRSRGAESSTYGTHPHRRTNAPGATPVELRRVRVHTRLPRSRGQAGATGACRSRQPRRALVAPPLPSHTFHPSRAQRHARSFPGLEPVVASRSPTPTAGGSTPSEPALAPDLQSGRAFLDNCRDIVAATSTTWPRHGSDAPWGAAGGNPAVYRHRGFDSLPAHHARHA